MRVRELSLDSFRNFICIQTGLSPGVNIIYGDNAQGKTNFLEAVYFCALGRPARASNDRELVRLGKAEARLRAEIERTGSFRTIDARIRLEGPRTIKTLAVDHVPVKKTSDLYGLLLVVLFSPEDLRLIKAGPSERRAFMDMEICQLSPVYCHDLRQYHHALKQRNALLKILNNGPKYKGPENPAETLDIWDEQLSRYGGKVMAARAAFVARIGEWAADIHARVTGGAEELNLAYRPNIEDPAAFRPALERARVRDIRLGSTSHGIHKDDMVFSINNRDARTYGSQGQQRTAALSAKLAEVGIIQESTGTAPVLLLDDVLSELDEKRQAFLLSQIGDLQTILTCTGVEDILKRNAAREARVMKMTGGSLSGA